ncbi:feruloyl-CoA synthase [Thalassococcus lentus]|uniref:Feruloyl-CoA synthase n=1 Tax=Thalassococcus lentus TaxID=1210524 RepID=A0ABT4XVN1_9RHOB|nr:feruloyl-CoA synthase [Thalassococcus lentus]MDA7426025.1 feruloyl-CoA synthase [Thalassococcus lentus]
MYRAHNVIREDRSDGAVILRSGYTLSPVARCSGEWLDHWAGSTPDAVFLAERDGAGWRSLSYSETRQIVRTIAAGLLARGMNQKTPILIISGNSVNHALLSLAAQYVGVPTAPVAEQYALIPGARPQLLHCAGLVKPAMVYAEDMERFGDALSESVFDTVEKVVSRGAAEGVTDFATLLERHETDMAQVDAAAAAVGPDTVAKYLLTSGSTSSPKAVITTQRMMCANQAQILDALPFLRTRPPRIVDWLPWNHVFGGSHNVNMMLSNGGALYIDAGKPVQPLVQKTIENNQLVGGTLAFNVPVGFAMLRDAMKEDEALRNRYFSELDMLFYAGASLPQDVWADLEAMARDVRGDMPLFTSSWGLTETAPACLIQHEPTDMSGIIGVPMTGVEVKLLPDEGGRFEIRVRGPNVMPGYLDDPEKTAAAFDEEGYFITGDAVRFVDESDLTKGLKFDGRVSEDFKLQSGTWVRAAMLRLELLTALGPLAQDVVLCGEGRNELGLMVIPTADARAMADDEEDVLLGSGLHDALRDRLGDQSGKGSSMRIARVMVLAEPPSIGDGEITAKGNLNARKVQTRRAALVERLYGDTDPGVLNLLR